MSTGGGKGRGIRQVRGARDSGGRRGGRDVGLEGGFVVRASGEYGRRRGGGQRRGIGEEKIEGEGGGV